MTRKAYSSVEDKRAIWPKSNIKDVTEKALKEANTDDQHEYVVISAPTVDITNLNTSNVQPSDRTDAFKEAVATSCKNMITTAEKALGSYPKIKKVVILKHPPSEALAS